MIANILCVGDVFGENGLSFLAKHLRPLQKLKNISFTVVNGENASVDGIIPRQADDIFSAGADVITLGNHAYRRQAILPYLDDNRYILRPANDSPLSPGRGWSEFDSPFGSVSVIDLIGRVGMDFRPDNPFFKADAILKSVSAKVILLDFHAEATSEKLAMAYYLDGRISGMFGTHTHVQTSDAHISGKGTGIITDVGMTGPSNSVIGVRPEQSLGHFLGDPDRKPYAAAGGECKMECVVFSVDTATGRCVDIEALRIT